MESKLPIHLVSVVIPTKNRFFFLRRAVESVFNQTWKNIEIIIVNDASTDNIIEFLEYLRFKFKNLYIINNEYSLGGAVARNQGIKIANGEYVAFLDDDDMWLPQKLEFQYALLKSDEKLSAVSCSYLYKSFFKISRVFEPQVPKNLQEILMHNKLGGTSLLFTSKNTLLKIGLFDEGLSSGQDWDLWIKLFQLGDIKVVNKPLAIYESHNGNRISTNINSILSGRKSMYFKYNNLMDRATKNQILSTIIFAKINTFNYSLIKKIKLFFLINRLAGSREAIKYIKWTMILFIKKFYI